MSNVISESVISNVNWLVKYAETELIFQRSPGSDWHYFIISHFKTACVTYVFHITCASLPTVAFLKSPLLVSGESNKDTFPGVDTSVEECWTRL